MLIVFSPILWRAQNKFSVTIIAPLMSCMKKLNYCRVSFVLRQHSPNKHIHSEKYQRHLLFLFYLFRDESELKFYNSGTYTDRVNEPSALTFINYNKLLIETYGALVDKVFTNFRSDINHNMDPFAQQENDEVIS